MKLTSRHEIFVFDDYPRQDLLLKSLGSFFENYQDRQGRKTNVKATMTEWNLDLDDIEFIKWGNSILAKIVELNLYHGNSFRFDSVWANIYRKGDYAIPHNHDPYRYSFVYFLKSKPNFSPLMFKDLGLRMNKVVRPIEGRLVIFPGFAPHWVPRHKHDETRITLSGNIL